METLNPSSSDLHVPSGLEVESASWRTKLQSVRPRVMEMKSKVAENANGVVTKVNGQLHAKPALFAGIAAGLGFALGLAGRIARHRRRAMKNVPAWVVVEGVC
jgi:ElaB/YqjD/DUF883 family membrane-anchored ribosome-binding protein